MAKNFGRVNVSVTASTGGLTAGLADATKQLAGFRNANSGATSSLSAMNAAADESSGMFSDIPGLFGGFAASLLGVSRGASAAAIGIKVLTLAMKTLLIPLGIVAAITAPFRALANAASSLDEASKAADRLGMSMTTFQNLSQVADEAGVSVQQMSSLFTRLGIQTTELARGSKSAIDAFGRIGVTLDQLQGLNPQQQFELISQRIMALPTAAERSAAAVAIFGKSGATAMGLIAAASNGAFSEVEKLREALGVNLTDSQVAGIKQMNDALSRLSLPMQGFINQFLAELAPAITTVANLIVDFFAKNTAGWSIAKSLADGFVLRIRLVVGAVTLLTGIFQVFMALGSKMGQMFSEVFSVILSGVSRVMQSMAALAEAAGFQDLADSLAEGSRGAREMAKGAAEMGQMYGDEAANSFAAGVENITNPFAAFDAGFAKAKKDAEEKPITIFAKEPLAKQIGASAAELKAIVSGSSEGESFRNMLARGGDPRLAGGDAAKETADNTERTADGVEDLASAVKQMPGFGQAQIAIA